MKKYMQYAGGVMMVAAVSTFPVAAFAEMKIGFVDTAKLSESAPQIKAAESKISAEFASREDELNAMKRKLDKLEEQLSKDGAVMSDTERGKLERDILSKRRELKRTQDEFRDDLNIRINEMRRQVNTEIFEYIVEFGKAGNYDLILTQGVAYAAKQADITDLILKKLLDGK